MTLPQQVSAPAATPDAPAVSIAIRAYRRRWLGEAIGSVLAQTFDDLEVVVYDDAGDLDDVAASFGDPRVRYHCGTREMGAAGLFAAALAPCRGRYLGVLDDDDRYEPEFVERLVAALEADPAAGVAFARSRWDLGDRLIAPRDPRPAGRVPDAARHILSGSYLIQPSLMLVRRAALDDAEAAQPLVDGVAPDLWLNATVAVRGWNHVLVDDVLVTRRWHDDQIARKPSAHDRAVATWESLDVPDPGLDALRAEQHARALLRRAAAHLHSGDNRAARADLDAAAHVDAAAWRGPRRLLQAAARTGPAARVAAASWFALPPVKRRRDLPPDAELRQRPAGGGLRRDVLTLGVGTVVAQILMVGVSPVITRLFTPAEIGAAAVLIGALGTWSVSSLTLDWAIPLARARDEAASLVALCLVIGVVLSGLAALAVALAGDTLARLAEIPEVAGWVWLLPAQLALGALVLTATGVLVRARRFGRLAAVRAAQAAAVAGTSVAVGVAGGGGGPLAAATTGGVLLSAGVAAQGALRGEWHALGRTLRTGLAGMGRSAGRWRHFAGWGTASWGLNVAREAIVPALVAALYGAAGAGLVFVAQRVLGAPVALAMDAVSRAWYGTASQIVRGGDRDMRAALVRVTRGLALGGAPLLVLAVVAGPPLFPLVFGNDFEAGGEVLAALAPLHFFLLISGPAGLTLMALDRTRLQSAFSGARLAGAVIAIAGVHAAGGSLVLALAAYAASMAAVSAAIAVAAWRLVGRPIAAQPNE